ncbi:hypothetical protein BG60_09065 [Caballeronia zhejiangensis]|uniref:Uncharacterized protein n=2 Tax=Burkholderiales TaxID=80840 RepID=A0A656QGA4_9BURK|nr:hypothetical protein BG58_28685 [Caballeronia jiangsuensis]KDR28875.1 hypothetical protein BG60_09065 [Caballeronia zhejiangensis]KWU19250.1 hypothetical protein AS149_13510 [Burkholderia cenocepacia]
MDARAAANKSKVAIQSDVHTYIGHVDMMFGNNKDSGFFPVGELAEAKQFRSGFAMAQTVAPTFPVLTAALSHFEYRAIESESEGAGSLAFEAVSHESANLLQISLQVGALNVHWLADASARELRLAMDEWNRAGKAAFALWLPDGAPSNCLFGTLELQSSFEPKSVLPGSREGKSPDTWDVLKAIIAIGNALQDAGAEQLGISNNREAVNILMTNHIKKVVHHMSVSMSSDFLAERASGTVH